MFKKINKKYIFLYLILLILIIFLLRNINNSNSIENLSNCESCSLEKDRGKVGWFSILGPLVNNQFIWSIEDAKNKFINTLDGTTIPASSNPTIDQFRK